MLQMLRRGGLWLEKASFCLALSVASNLTFVFPCGALVLILTLLLAREGQARAALDRLIVPVTVVAFAITILPLLHAEMNSFYVGEKQLSDSAKSVLWIAWEHHEGRPLSFTWMLPALLHWPQSRFALCWSWQLQRAVSRARVPC